MLTSADALNDDPLPSAASLVDSLRRAAAHGAAELYDTLAAGIALPRDVAAVSAAHDEAALAALEHLDTATA